MAEPDVRKGMPPVKLPREEFEKRYQERRDWIDLGVRTASMPYLRIAAVLIAPAGA